MSASAGRRTAPTSKSRYDSIMELWYERSVPIEGRCVVVRDSRNPKPDSLYRVAYHPVLGKLPTPDDERRIMAEIDQRYARLDKDSLLTTEMFYVMKPYFEYLRHEDPHYRVMPVVPIDSRYKSVRDLYRRLRMPALGYLCVNDTIVVDASLEKGLRRGDMITAVNGVPIKRYLECCYDDRYNTINVPLRYYRFSDMCDKFKIDFVRDGCSMTVETEGVPQSEAMTRLASMSDIGGSVRYYDDAHCGYVAISAFYPDNSRLIRILHKAMVDFRKRGYKSVILDLRRNSGGNGGDFDRLMSIFINRPTVRYCSGQRVMVSKRTLGLYDFLNEDMEGQVVELPADEYVSEFTTIPKMYVDGLNVYVMMSRNTGSIAASFCNILQYNDAARLVGEPLMHNALKYGETVWGKRMLPVQMCEVSVSTVEIDEYTRAVDGVLMPDIPIPYVAADYLDGSDAMLDKLLDIIRRVPDAS